MAITLYTGDTAQIQFPLSYSNGTKPNLAGFTSANFTLHFYNATGPTTIVCAGSFVIIPSVDPTTGIISYNTVGYTPLASEVGTAAAWQAWLTVHFPGYDKTWTFDTINILTKF